MRVILFEDAGVNNLQPLTLTRPAFDLRCGAVSLLERLERILPTPVHAALIRPELTDLCRINHPRLEVNEAVGDEKRMGRESVLLVNARWLAPAASPLSPSGMGVDKGEVGL